MLLCAEYYECPANLRGVHVHGAHHREQAPAGRARRLEPDPLWCVPSRYFPCSGQFTWTVGWTANCAAIKVVVTPAIGLSLPESWDGPFVAVFPEGVGIAIAAIGGLLGSSLIYMLCNM